MCARARLWRIATFVAAVSSSTHSSFFGMVEKMFTSPATAHTLAFNPTVWDAVKHRKEAILRWYFTITTESFGSETLSLWKMPLRISKVTSPARISGWWKSLIAPARMC